MSTIDKVETISGATIQHGPFNKRIYLMKLTDLPGTDLYETLLNLAQKNGYEKICLKIPRSAALFFQNRGFNEEASIPGFYRGSEEGVFLGRFLSPVREKMGDPSRLDAVLKLAESKRIPAEHATPKQHIPPVEMLGEAHAPAMADIYRKVFPSYPFPIDRPDYLMETMHSHVHYFGIRQAGRLVALSSAEYDKKSLNVEMTDFATLPEHRGQGYAQHLLSQMEAVMTDLGFITAYTIARAISPGMNITFTRQGYRYGGRLRNNTHISGQIESMNVWYKRLTP